MSVSGVYNYNNTSTVAGGNNSSRLSSGAQAYLDDLKQRNPGVNITVASFANEKQFDQYIFGSSGAANVAVAANIIEKMASDPATAAKYEPLIAEMPENAKATQKFCDEHNSILYASGMVIDRNGKVSYWAVGGDKEPRINPGTVYKEKIQAVIKEKEAAKAEEKAIEEKRLKKAESLQGLFNQLSSGKAAANTEYLNLYNRQLDMRIKS